MLYYSITEICKDNEVNQVKRMGIVKISDHELVPTSGNKYVRRVLSMNINEFSLFYK